jgi:hypothetical protein
MLLALRPLPAKKAFMRSSVNVSGMLLLHVVPVARVGMHSAILYSLLYYGTSSTVPTVHVLVLVGTVSSLLLEHVGFLLVATAASSTSIPVLISYIEAEC